MTQGCELALGRKPLDRTAVTRLLGAVHAVTRSYLNARARGFEGGDVESMDPRVINWFDVALDVRERGEHRPAPKDSGHRRMVVPYAARPTCRNLARFRQRIALQRVLWAR